MGIVGGEYQVAVTDLLQDVVGNDFVGFDGNDTLAFEILAGLFFDIFGPDIAVKLPGFVESS